MEASLLQEETAMLSAEEARRIEEQAEWKRRMLAIGEETKSPLVRAMEAHGHLPTHEEEAEDLPGLPIFGRMSPPGAVSTAVEGDQASPSSPEHEPWTVSLDQCYTDAHLLQEELPRGGIDERSLMALQGAINAIFNHILTLVMQF